MLLWLARDCGAVGTRARTATRYPNILPDAGVGGDAQPHVHQDVGRPQDVARAWGGADSAGDGAVAVVTAAAAPGAGGGAAGAAGVALLITVKSMYTSKLRVASNADAGTRCPCLPRPAAPVHCEAPTSPPRPQQRRRASMRMMPDACMHAFERDCDCTLYSCDSFVAATHKAHGAFNTSLAVAWRTLLGPAATVLNAIAVATALPRNNFKLEYAGDTYDMLQKYDGSVPLGPKIGEVFLIDGGVYKAARLFKTCEGYNEAEDWKPKIISHGKGPAYSVSESKRVVPSIPTVVVASVGTGPSFARTRARTHARTHAHTHTTTTAPAPPAEA